MKRLFLSCTLLFITWHVNADALSIVQIGEIKMSKVKISKEKGGKEQEFEWPTFFTSLAGQQGSFILDTAVSPSMLTPQLAQKLKLYEKRLFDPSHTLVMFSQLKLPFTLGSRTIYLDEAAVLQHPHPFFQQYNIVGLFNPHSIGCKNCLIVLDFINKEFYVAVSESTDKVLTALDTRYFNLPRISAKYVSEIGQKTNMIRISGVSVNNHPQDSVLLDTGAAGTSFLKKSVGKISIVKKTHTMDATGKLSVAEITTPLSISLNGKALAKIPVWVEDKSAMTTNESNPLRLDRQGDIGMDIMKNCVVALEQKKAVHFYCKSNLH